MMKAESPVLLACLPASAGDTCGPVVSVEGVATNDNAFIRYSVLDGEGGTIKTITRHFRVAVDAAITLDAMTCGGGALVVKRPTDPARFNCATGTVSITGAASGLRLEGNKVCFEPGGAEIQAIDCDENGATFIFYGVTPSETMNDATIALKTAGGETLVSTNLTVLWVDISMRCGQGESLSPDNGLSAQYPQGILGACQTITNVAISGCFDTIADSISNVAEFVGKVHPSVFPGQITLNRSFTGMFSATSNGSSLITTNLYRPSIPWPGDQQPHDTGPVVCRDDNPLPNGYVYDVDTPGIRIDAEASGANIQYGTIMFIRDNFVEYAMIGTVRCSDDFAWFNSGTFRKIGTVGILLFDFYNRGNHNLDNAIGPGRIPLTSK